MPLDPIDRPARGASAAAPVTLYTPEERLRRDRSAWTGVQGLLAPIQFLVCAVSIAFVVHALRTGDGYRAAQLSVVLKTVILYLIMVTGAIWEKEVFGQYLFARPFFWEDVVSFLVLALHTAYLWFARTGTLADRGLCWLALAAYTAYVVNAVQFVLKLRAARLQEQAARTRAAPRLAPAGAAAA
ncbi:MAG: 2-vinyl bacteriochlorophyllide hydratase [Gemmatimonadales bacterium]|nr:2-vinyl bacteriochlorophyllide hydratase [Gemmatimonadales bacterium]